jgi:hypothetical protein
MSDKKFSEQLTITIDKCITQYDHYLLMGDLNYDLLAVSKRGINFSFRNK